MNVVIYIITLEEGSIITGTKQIKLLYNGTDDHPSPEPIWLSISELRENDLILLNDTPFKVTGCTAGVGDKDAVVINNVKIKF